MDNIRPTLCRKKKKKAKNERELKEVKKIIIKREEKSNQHDGSLLCITEKNI